MKELSARVTQYHSETDSVSDSDCLALDMWKSRRSTAVRNRWHGMGCVGTQHALRATVEHTTYILIK